jgi:acetolactate synthase I/II/III large subunit
VTDQSKTVHAGVAAAEALVRHGVDTLFTLSGGHLFSLYDGCVQQGIRLVDTRHEQAATFAAEAYAKVSRRPGIAALTAGPGVTNGMSAITTAYWTGSPITVIGGRAPQARWGSGSLQELDHVPLVASVTKHAATSTDPTLVGSDVHQAVLEARRPHRGPTFLDVPMDVFFGQATLDAVPASPAAADLVGVEPDPDALARVGRLIAEADRPVILAGSDVYFDGAEAALVRLAEGARVPVIVSGMGRGTIPADHPLALSRSRSVALKGADLVVVVGQPLDFRVGFGRFAGGRTVHVVDSPERVATHVELTASAAGDLTTVLDGIVKAATAAMGATGASRRGHDAWVERLQDEERALRSVEADLMAADTDPIHPARIYGELRARLERDAIVIGDGGDFVSYAGKYVDTFHPGSFLDPGPYGCLGTGPGYALGAAMAAPGRQLVLLLGDGAAGFSLGDWDTLARFGVPVVGIVGNNSCWGLEKHPMQAIYGYHVVAELAPGTRYDKVAEALGCHGELVSNADELGPALDRAFACGGPALVNVLTDPENAYPRATSLG